MGEPLAEVVLAPGEPVVGEWAVAERDEQLRLLSFAAGELR